jgi:hypothetical protein
VKGIQTLPPKKPIPIKSPENAKLFRDRAFAQLKEKWDGSEGEEFDPSSEPIITPRFKYAEGGIPYVLEALRSHDEEDARTFMELYDSLSQRDRQYLSLEEIAYASGIGSLRLAEIATSATIVHGQMASKLILATAMPGIVRTSVRLAKTAKGGFDREMMLKAGGVLPVPKGAQIAIQNNVSAENSETKVKEAEPAWLDAGDRLRMIHAAVEPRRLPSPSSTPINIGGRLDHMQSDVAEVLSGDV